MTKARRATVDEFPIGCTVRVERLPKHHQSRTDNHLDGFIGWIGKVSRRYGVNEEEGPWIELNLGPTQRDYCTVIVRPWWIERGRIEWTPFDQGATAAASDGSTAKLTPGIVGSVESVVT